MLISKRNLPTESVGSVLVSVGADVVEAVADMKPAADVRIVPATEEDTSAIERFLFRYFFPEEPLNASLGRRPDKVPFLTALKDGLCLKAVDVLLDSEESLVGVVLNKEVSPTDKKELSADMSSKELKIRKILKELEERSRIWETVNNEKHFNIMSVSVHSRYRGLGIGRKLLEESVRVAESLGHRYVSIECSSFYSAALAASMGFEVVYEIAYEEYVDERGEQIFRTSPPHRALKKMMKRL